MQDLFYIHVQLCYQKSDASLNALKLVQELNLVQKTFKWPKMLDNFWDILTLKGAGRQTVHTTWTFGVSLKLLVYPFPLLGPVGGGRGALSYQLPREKSSFPVHPWLVASKLGEYEPDEKILRTDKEKDEKVIFS